MLDKQKQALYNKDSRQDIAAKGGWYMKENRIN